MATKIRFSKSRLEALSPTDTGKRLWVYDESIPGLALQITTTGAKSFYLYRSVQGRPEKVRLGSFPAMSVEQARKAAQGVLAEIAKGNNPSEQKRQAKAEMTLAELHHLWMEHAKTHKRSWRQDQSQFDLYLANWTRKKLSSIDRSAIRSLHQSIGKNNGHYAANRLLSLLSVMFNFAIRQHNVAIDNPCLGIKRFSEEKREAWIKPENMPAFFKALNEEPNQDIRDFFYLALLTGARRGNMLSMSWQDINLEQGLWTIPASSHKTNRTHTIPLSKPAIEILRRRSQNVESTFVFPGTGKTGHFVEPIKAWRRITQRAGLEGLRPHDLRHTLASWQATNGVSLAITGKALGHSSTSTTARYAHLAVDPVREANEQAAKAIYEASGNTKR